jgi:hypothetical protein
MADANKPTERYLVTPRGFRFRIRPAGNRSEVLIGPHAKALAKNKKQAKATPEPSEGPSRSGETSTKPPS